MKRILFRTKKDLLHFTSEGEKVEGLNPLMSLFNRAHDMYGDCTGLKGDCGEVKGDCTRLSGDCSTLWGEVSGLSGNCTGLTGDCTGLAGYLGMSGFPTMTQAAEMMAPDYTLIPIEEERLSQE